MMIAVVIFFYGMAFVCASNALWRSRTPQGATAWFMALLSFPFIAVPLFLIFGRNKFHGYVRQRKEVDAQSQKELSEIEYIYSAKAFEDNRLRALNELCHRCQQPGITESNNVDLLINAENTYHKMLEDIEQATEYILVQFYIFRTDEVGQRFIQALKRKVDEGLKVYLLFDAIGSRISSRQMKKWRELGIEVSEFKATKFFKTKFQLNFRNHRKLIVIDGKISFIGGHNIGLEYLGKSKKRGHWRDTHARLEGPGALAAQVCFARDWYWAQEELPQMSWKVHRVQGAGQALVLPSGPSDEGDTALLALIELINSANKKVWMSTPYFIPPEGLLNALELAALRGVDVRILLPGRNDSWLIRYASKVFQERALEAKINVYSYNPGFVHQKVMVVDDSSALVSSINLDSRSFFINFEIALIALDPEFIRQVTKMLKDDYANSTPVNIKNLREAPFFTRLFSRLAGLLSPML